MSSASQSIPPDSGQIAFSMPTFPDRKLTTHDIMFSESLVDFLRSNQPSFPTVKSELLMQGIATVIEAGVLFVLDPCDKRYLFFGIAASVACIATMIFTYTNASNKFERHEEAYSQFYQMRHHFLGNDVFTPKMCHFLFNAKSQLPSIFYSLLSRSQVLDGTNGDLEMIEKIMPNLNPYLRETFRQAIELLKLKTEHHKTTPFVQLLDTPEWYPQLLNSADLLKTAVWLFKKQPEFQQEWEEVDRYVAELDPQIERRLKENTLTVKFSDGKVCRIAKRIFRKSYLQAIPLPNFAVVDDVTLGAFDRISLMLLSRESDLITSDMAYGVDNTAKRLADKIKGMPELIIKYEEINKRG